MLRTSVVWLTLTLLASVLLGGAAYEFGPEDAFRWMAGGLGTSLVTLLATATTVRLARLAGHNSPKQALHRLLLETAIRMTLPLGALLAVVVTRDEIINPVYLLYFLPFPFITLFAETWGAVGRVKAEDSLKNGPST